jgi:hypothetical protein
MGKFVLLPKYMEFLTFQIFCRGPDDGFLKLKPVAWLRIASVFVGCDCTVDNSKVYFYMHTPTGLTSITKNCAVGHNSLETLC